MRKLLIGGVLSQIVVSQSALALDVTGSWVAKWPNGAQNEISLRSDNGRLSGICVNDARDQCTVSGNFVETNRHIVLTIKCPRWDIRMQGTVSADGRTASGTYQAYVAASGQFTMEKQ